MSVAVMLPTYNEVENIENLIHDIQSLNLDLTIAVIDDSSPDGTADIVRKLQKKRPGKIHLVSRSDKLGLGTAITDGFKFLLSLDKPPRYIIAMDADYSHNPKDIPKLVEVAREGYDLVIGSRYLDGGEVVGSSLTRRLISRLANVVAGVIVRARMHDCTSGFRCYSKRYIRNVLPSLHSQTYEIQIETVKQARLNGFKIKEIPITFVNRKRGKSKLTAMESQAFITYIVRAMLGNSVSSRKVPQETENNTCA
jgi:glycosyltransferase involved in cell wall biosynthesis